MKSHPYAATTIGDKLGSMPRDILTSPYDSIADMYDAAFNGENIYYGTITEREREMFEHWIPKASGNQRALDVGCGTGFHTEWLVRSGYDTIGIDISPAMLQVAKRKLASDASQVCFQKCDAMELSRLGNERFDVVLCLGSTLNHISEWQLCLWQMISKTKPGGRLLFSFDNIYGADTLFWLLKQGRSIYRDGRPRRTLIERIWHGIRGLPFHNHMHMEVSGSPFELPLTYEPARKVRQSIEDAGARSLDWVGVHILTSLNRRIMEAGAFIEDSGRPSGLGTERFLFRLDRALSRPLYWMGANIIVACKVYDNMTSGIE